MGNDIAGGLVLPVLEVYTPPSKPANLDDLGRVFPTAFPACAVTRAQSRRLGNVCDIEDSVFSQIFSTDELVSVTPRPKSEKAKAMPPAAETESEFFLPVTGKTLKEAQKADTSLAKCFSTVVSLEKSVKQRIAYLLEVGLLLRKWMSRKGTDCDWSSVCQIVVPKPFRSQVPSLAHDIPWAGHLGVTKTYDRILRHLFWPGLKQDVAQHCKSCHTCQLMGKPNQGISPAPLQPIPVMGEPFERVIVDCVGPLPRTKSGNQYLLTIMCAATRYPEAIPLRKITSKVIVAALTKFFSTFGLPKVVQTDQGSNFMSKRFAQVLKTLGITHQVSSAYHPLRVRVL